MKALTIGSLFAGVGGLELGLECAGLGPVLWQVEIVPFCRRVLAKHWPDAERHDDVRAVGASTLRRVDLICGGFPCQDVSSAGARAGMGGSRSGLWREFARIIGEIRPAWVVVENVASGATRWLDVVQGDLAKLGYASLPIPVAASDCGAPHRRARIFVVAHADDQPIPILKAARANLSGSASDAHGDIVRHESWGGGRAGGAGSPEPGEASADAVFARREGSGARSHEGWARSLGSHGWASQPGVAPVVYELPGGLVGRRRRERVRALGNCVVPAQAQVAGEVIQLLRGAA